MKKYLLSAGLTILAMTLPAAAAQDALRAFVDEQARDLMESAAIQSAVRAANMQSQALDEAAILDMDNLWRGQIGTSATPDIDKIMQMPASEELRKFVQDSNGSVLEIIVMDSRGLNAAISGITSDYWQGDEDKYQQTYLKGPDAVHISEAEFDDSTQSYVVQVSFVITDAAGQAIGAATFGLNAEAF